MSLSSRTAHLSIRVPRHQRGAVLYTALIMLIVLALLGIAGMQVAGMQEKMAANYRATNRAFQNAELVARSAEATIEAIENRVALPDTSLLTSNDISLRCDDGFDPVAWGAEQRIEDGKTLFVRRIEKCIEGGGSLGMGGPIEEKTPVYQITSHSPDDDDNPTSSVVLDTVFKL